MALIKDESSILRAVLGVLLVVFLGFLVSKNPSDDSESPALSSVSPTASDEKTEITPDIQGSSTKPPATSIKQVNSGADMLSLIAGEKFSLVTEFNSELDTIVLEVFNVSRNSKFTQLQSRGSDGSVSVVTLTPTLTSILLKTPTNIFEYAGNEFNGVLSQVASLDLSDDVREVKSIARPNKEDFQRRKVSE
ncbi:hypothetical protein OAK31_00425 [Gammaproteobacteria bacterium]|nr:hypothetical protein [Gammaproteobacteria bacterium]